MKLTEPQRSLPHPESFIDGFIAGFALKAEDWELFDEFMAEYEAAKEARLKAGRAKLRETENA